jgi:hypothetical protein
MRTSKIILVFFTGICWLQGAAQIGEQGSVNMSAGADVLIAESPLRNTHRIGFGGTLKGEYVFAKHISATLSTGFYSFAPDKDVTTVTQRLSGIPIRGGFRYYLGNFYVGSDAGVVFQQGFATGSSFAYSFSVGDEIVTNKRNGNSLDISLRHEGWLNRQAAQFIGLRLAWEFRIRR